MSPQALMSPERIERLFISQRQWERGDVGSLCERGDGEDTLLSRKQFVLRYFVGALKPGRCTYPSTNTKIDVLFYKNILV